MTGQHGAPAAPGAPGRPGMHGAPGAPGAPVQPGQPAMHRAGDGNDGWTVPSSYPPGQSAPAFGRGPVPGPVVSGMPSGPGAHHSIRGEIRPRGPVNRGQHPNMHPPVPAPGVTPPYGMKPRPVPDEVVRRRAGGVRNWGVVAAILFALGALAEWGSYQSPGGSALMSMLFTPLSDLMYFTGVVAGGVLGAYVIAAMRALAERARRWRPPLARSQKAITAMHLWPVRNITGPVVILAETGVRGPGTWVWFAACAMWPLTLASVFISSTAIDVFRTGLLAALAAALTAITGAMLARAMSPPDPRRLVPGAGATAAGDGAHDDRPFWSRGLVTPPRETGPKTIVPPIDDAITSLYEEKP